jgi:hypothetical protein
MIVAGNRVLELQLQDKGSPGKRGNWGKGEKRGDLNLSPVLYIHLDVGFAWSCDKILDPSEEICHSRG